MVVMLTIGMLGGMSWESSVEYYAGTAVELGRLVVGGGEADLKKTNESFMVVHGR